MFKGDELTQLNTFRCDRCRKVYNLTEDQTPLHIEHRDLHDVSLYDLCEDCNASFYFLMDYQTYGTRIDAMIEQIINEEEGIE